MRKLSLRCKNLKYLGIDGTGKHGLPESSHSSTAYLKMNQDRTFNVIRIHDMYHRKFGRTKAIKATKAMKKHFEKYLKGVTL